MVFDLFLLFESICIILCWSRLLSRVDSSLNFQCIARALTVHCCCFLFQTNTLPVFENESVKYTNTSSISDCCCTTTCRAIHQQRRWRWLCRQRYEYVASCIHSAVLIRKPYTCKAYTYTHTSTHSHCPLRFPIYLSHAKTNSSSLNVVYLFNCTAVSCSVVSSEYAFYNHMQWLANTTATATTLQHCHSKWTSFTHVIRQFTAIVRFLCFGNKREAVGARVSVCACARMYVFVREI